VQLKMLRRQLSRLNVTIEDWKLLVVYIGAVDLCHFGCNPYIQPGAVGSPEHFEMRIRAMLDTIRTSMPKTIVSFLLIPDLSQQLLFMKKNRIKRACGELDTMRIARAQCPCAINNNDQARWSLSSSVMDYNERILRVAHEYNRDLDGPLVQVSGVLRDTLPHKHFPPAFLSQLDCLHYTNLAHRSLAVRYWRSLYQKLSEQPQFLAPDEDIYCPRDDDHIVLYNGEESIIG
jgi:hypothetical protein